MSKKNKKDNSKPERAFIVRKLSLQEWQIIDLEIMDDMVVSRTEREPNVAAVVGARLMAELRKNE